MISDGKATFEPWIFERWTFNAEPLTRDQWSVGTGERTDVRAWEGKELDVSQMNESEPISVLWTDYMKYQAYYFCEVPEDMEIRNPNFQNIIWSHTEAQSAQRYIFSFFSTDNWLLITDSLVFLRHALCAFSEPLNL